MNTKSKTKTPSFICFTGTDGAGKTTLAKAFNDKQWEAHQIEYRYIDAGVYYTYILSAIRRLFRKIKPKKKSGSKSVSTHDVVIKKTNQQKSVRNVLYAIILLIDYAFTTFIKVSWPLRRGHRLTSARYVYDIAIKLRMLFGLDDDQTHAIIRRFTAVFPTPNPLFLIDIPEEVALARKDDIASITYLVERRQLYYRIMQPYVTAVLDGCKPINELLLEVEKHIQEEHQTAD